jgi:Fe-S cluster assembly protein SufD
VMFLIWIPIYCCWLMEGITITVTVAEINCPGVSLAGSLAQAAKEFPDIVEKHYGNMPAFQKDGLVALNTAFAQDGIFIYVQKGLRWRSHPDSEHNDSDTGLMAQHRNLFVVEEDAVGRYRNL